ncbi:MAG TPA: hypothetical protein VMH83_11980 [Candidatus Acidoferrum sp.]|nr:hypothetical protein [Candidatus Acidoferrum sp.]
MKSPRILMLSICFTLAAGVADANAQSANLPVQNLIQANSRDSFDKIPKSVVYQAVFFGLVTNQYFLDGIPEEDAELISNLPSHADRQFAEPEFMDNQRICNELVSDKARGDPNYVDTMHKIGLSQKVAQSRLDQHYENVLARLAPDTRKKVQDKVTQLQGTGAIGYATPDMEAISRNNPEAAPRLTDRFCNSILNSRVQFSSKLMADDLKGGTPFSTAK